MQYLSTARHAYGEGRYRETVENLRQSLNAIVGRTDDEETNVETLQAKIKAMVGDKDHQRYQDRIDLIRLTTKFLCDLGAHPETDETSRAEATSALHMTVALLHWYTRQIRRPAWPDR